MADDVNPAPTTVVKPDIDAIPYARFKEILEQKKAAEDKLSERDNADKKAAEEKLLKEKKFEELLKSKDIELQMSQSQLSDMSQKLKALEEEEKKQREELLAEIKDDNDKEIAGELTLASLRRFVARLKSNGGSPGAIKGTKGAAGSENPYLKQADESYNQYQARIAKLRSTVAK